MKQLLRIDSSLRREGSYSRRLADFYQEHWQLKNPEGKVVCRDLTADNIEHISDKTIKAFFADVSAGTSEQDQSVVLSDRLIDEFIQSDEVLLSSPLYNLNIPSVLKSYLDHIVRVNRTFKYSEDGGSITGLVTSTKVNIISVKGGIYKGTPFEKNDFQEPYLVAIMNFMGIKDIRVFSLEGTSRKDQLENEISKIKKQIVNHVHE